MVITSLNLLILIKSSRKGFSIWVLIRKVSLETTAPLLLLDFGFSWNGIPLTLLLFVAGSGRALFRWWWILFFVLWTAGIFFRSVIFSPKGFGSRRRGGGTSSTSDSSSSEEESSVKNSSGLIRCFVSDKPLKNNPNEALFQPTLFLTLLSWSSCCFLLPNLRRFFGLRHFSPRNHDLILTELWKVRLRIHHPPSQIRTVKHVRRHHLVEPNSKINGLACFI